ncbi:porin family protein [Flavilitoribacter nigricans]|nr:porin family protein [Flavilitoribacter nigricans]
MKKLSLALFVAALVALTTTTFAQTFSIGPRVGVNFANLTSDGSDFQNNTLLVAGITSTYSINEKAGIGVDLLYSGEGAESNNFGDLALNYVRLPIMFQYFFRELGDDFRPKIYAGVAPGLLVNAEQGEREVIDNYNKFDFAGTAGLGFHYRITGGTWLNTDVRYLRGFSNVIDATPELYNQHVQVSVGLSFGIE